MINILHITKNEIPKDLRYDEIFVDTNSFASLEEAALFAVQLRNITQGFEPIVVGPVTTMDAKSQAIFIRDIIRVTPLSFEEYVKDLNDSQYES